MKLTHIYDFVRLTEDRNCVYPSVSNKKKFSGGLYHSLWRNETAEICISIKV